ncbi:MAG: hypothetical protein CMJ64_28510 [Planctomycetaceae bacterium]|nr:hypothetical protein [Planctomycetaceae bacterium]
MIDDTCLHLAFIHIHSSPEGTKGCSRAYKPPEMVSREQAQPRRGDILEMGTPDVAPSGLGLVWQPVPWAKAHGYILLPLRD